MIKSADYPWLDLSLVLVRFPEKADQIRQLASDVEDFHEICEHYSLARAALDRFQRQSADGQRPEVAEYKLLIADLEREIQESIERGPEAAKQR